MNSSDASWTPGGQQGGDGKLSLPCLKEEWWKRQNEPSRRLKAALGELHETALI